MPNFHDDAASLLAYAQNQAAIIERDVWDESRDMADIVYPRFVPITGGDPMAQSVIFTSQKRAGAAAFINGKDDDVPLADTALDVTTKPVLTAAIGYGWGWDELRRSMALGINLQSERAIAARRAYEEMMQRLVFDGDSKRGLKGLNGVTNSQATDVSGDFTGNWAGGAATAQVIAADLITLLRGTGNGEQPTANRIVLPSDEHTYALTTFFPNSSLTALTLIQQQYPGVQITSRKALEDISGAHKYLAYRYDPTSISFSLPLPLQFMPVYQSGPLRFEVPGVFRVGGLNIKRKNDFAFAAKS